MFVTLFNQFWWLIFPLAFMVFGVFREILRSEERRRTISLIRAYTDKGLDVPPALLKVLKY